MLTPAQASRLVLVPTRMATRQQVARRLLGAVRGLGLDVHLVRRGRGGYVVPRLVAEAAGYERPRATADPAPDDDLDDLAGREAQIPAVQDDPAAFHVKPQAGKGSDSKTDTRVRVAALLAEHPDWSRRRVATELGVSATTVARAIRALEQHGPHMVDGGGG